MTIFKLDFKGSLKGMLLWSGIVALVLIMFMALFPSMTTDAMKDLTATKLSAMPSGLLKALGLEEIPDFTNIIEYYAYIFQFIILAGAVYAMLLGTSALIKEETDGTIEYLYAQPVTRTSIVGQKLLSIIGSYVSFVWITGLVSAVLFTVLNPKGSDLMTVLINMKTILAGMFFTGLIFLCLGLFLSTVIKSAKQATPLGMGIVFLTYVIGMLGSAFSASLERVKVLKYLSPIDYSMPLNVVKHGFDTTSLVIGITVILLSTAAAFIIYQRKDLRS